MRSRNRSATRFGAVRRKLPRVSVGLAIAAALALASTAVSTAGASAGSTAAPLTAAGWRAEMAHVATPAEGCYTAAYPVRAWHGVACAAAPKLDFAPNSGAVESGGVASSAAVRAAGAATRTKNDPEIVGAGEDYSAEVNGLLTSATGTFPVVQNVTEETGENAQTSQQVPNSFSLQLDSAPFATALCDGQPDCSGWEQFLFSNPGDDEPGSVFIEFWLVDVGPEPCPGEWTSFEGESGQKDCYLDSPAQELPGQPITNLGNMSLTGTVSGTQDTVSLSTGGDSLYTVSAPGVLELAKEWNAAEFLVGGDGDGTQANFNAGASITAQTATRYGSSAAPTCLNRGWSAETNNLSLVGTPAFTSGALPAIRSKQSNAEETQKSCAVASGNGDTHLETFGGTYYDFQAEGTFTLAQTSTMTVQTQQESGAPTWPQAAVNAAVGTQMGADSVALCASDDDVIVDGAATAVADGQTLTLPSGDAISRTGTVYVVTDPQGDSMQATMNGTHIDVSVGLGSYPETVSGLLANAPGSNDELETSKGEVIDTPVDLQTLYDVYGDSWRVAAGDSLVSACDEPAENADPTAPFWADELSSSEQSQGESVCEADGVTNATLLEACTLDVAVLGDSAAASYEGESAPADVAFSEDTSGSSASPSPSPSTSTSQSSSSAKAAAADGR